MQLVFISLFFYITAFLLSFLSYTFDRLRLFVPIPLFLALFFYTLYTSLLAIKVGSFPFADPYGFYSLLGNVLVGFLSLMSFKYTYAKRFYALFSVLGMLSTLLLIPAEPSPYRSPLYSLHISVALLSYVSSILGGLSALFRLLAEAKLKKKSFSEYYMPINVLRGAERLFMNLCFLFLSLTLLFGSLWSRSYFGRHWVDDPKLLFVLFLWLYYAVVVHLNLTRRIKPKNLSYAVLAGMLLSLLSLFLVKHEV